MRMRELISCKYRSKMIITPEPPVTLDHYFRKEGLDADSWFTEAVEKGENIQRISEKERWFDRDMMFMTQNDRQQIGDILHAPNKVKQLYEEQDMATPDSSGEDTVFEEETRHKCNESKETSAVVSGDDTEVSCDELEKEPNENTSPELKEGKDDILLTEKFVATESNDHMGEFILQGDDIEENECSEIINHKDQEEVIVEGEMKEIDEDGQSKLEDVSSLEETVFRETSRNSSPVSKESSDRKTQFFNLPEIDHFFELTNITKKKKKNKNRQNSFRKSSKTSHKRARTDPRSEYPLAIAKINRILTGKNRSNSDIAKELKLFSSQVMVSQRLKRQNLLYSRISLPQKYQPDKDVHITKGEHKKNMPVSQKSPNSSHRNRNVSRVSGYRSNRSHTLVSVSDIGIGLT